jgi:hypothetical protein
MNESLRDTKVYVALLVLLWFFSAFVGGWWNMFAVPGKPPILLGVLFLVPILLFSSSYSVSSQFRAWANSISLSWIVGLHVWRIVGLGFVIAYLFGKLPAQFGVPEGFGDIIAAVFALPLALAIRRQKPVRGYFILWNVFGLVDLLSAITVGLLYSDGPLGVLRTGISTALMTTFPINLIPTFLVPLFILLHLLALVRRNEVRASVADRDLILQSRGV